jgi:hypothetical protein
MKASFDQLRSFTLDGGRILCSVIRALVGDWRSAAEIPSFGGRGLSFLLIFEGVPQTLHADRRSAHYLGSQRRSADSIGSEPVRRPNGVGRVGCSVTG